MRRGPAHSKVSNKIREAVAMTLLEHSKRLAFCPTALTARACKATSEYASKAQDRHKRSELGVQGRGPSSR